MKASITVCTRLSIIISHRKSITNDLKIKQVPIVNIGSNIIMSHFKYLYKDATCAVIINYLPMSYKLNMISILVEERRRLEG